MRPKAAARPCYGRIVLLFLPFLLYASALRAETLEVAWQIATEVNNKLHAQGHQIRAARAELQAARAGRHPVLSNQTAYVALSEQPSYSIAIPEIPLPIALPDSVSMPLSDQAFGLSATTVTVPLYTGGKINAAVEANRYLVNAAYSGYAVSTQELKLEVAETYFNVLRTRQLWEVAKDAERSTFRHQKDVEKLLEQKIVTRNALLAAQTAWAAAAQRVLQTETLVLSAESAYNRYMARPLDFPVLIEEIPVPPTSGDLNILSEEAMRCRKELNVIASQSRASASLAKVSHADRLPQVVALGGLNYMQNSYLDQETYWSGAVAMKWTPLDGGASRAKEHAAMETAAAAAKMRDETRSMVLLQVRTSWLAEHETRGRIEVAKLGKEQADENLRVVTRQFQEGLVNHTEVLDAQTQQTAAATNLCNATYDAILATYRLKRAIGLLY